MTRPAPEFDPSAAGRSDYCTIEEVAQRLRLSPKRVRNMMATGIFVEGREYFRRAGLRPRFRWSRVVAWLEDPVTESPDVIPMAHARRVALPRPTGL